MKRLIILLFASILLITSNVVYASHSMGGELSYTWQGGNVYQVSLNFYRDCDGIPAPSQVSINITSSCYPGRTVTLSPTTNSPQEISPLCPNAISSCMGGFNYGVQKWTYTGSVTLNGPCVDWMFSFTECCRNAAITNVPGASGYSMYLNSTLDNSSTPFNSSVQFSSDPVPFLFVNQMHVVNNGLYDPDNDSLAIRLVAPRNTSNTDTLVYATGFSSQNPLTVSSPISFDPSTGNFTISPIAQEVTVLAYLVEEFRNGQRIASTVRDFQIRILPNTNYLPLSSGVNGSNDFIISVCAGDTVNFNIQSSDGSTSDSTYYTILPNELSSSLTTVQYPVGQFERVDFSLVTDSTMIRPVAYSIPIELRDDHCPYYGKQSYVIQVYVNGCTADVWPGDANSDLDCDLYDILPIGLGYGATGPFRMNTSNNWNAQSAVDWNRSFVTGVEYKHADCNGDGIIDNNDTAAIYLNYGSNHPLRMANPWNDAATDDRLRIVASVDTAGPGSRIIADVLLGDSANPVTDAYGLAFRISFDTTNLDLSNSAFNFVASQLGTSGTDLLPFSKEQWANGYIDAAAVRIDHQSRFVNGVIARLELQLRSTVNASSLLNVTLFDGIYSDETGQTTVFVPASDSVTVSYIPSVASNGFSVFPDPANTNIQFTNSEDITRIRCFDSSGRLVYDESGGDHSGVIPTANWPEGTYLLELTSVSGPFRKTVRVVH